MIHSAGPQSRPTVIVARFWSFGMDGRTLCVKILITTGLLDQQVSVCEVGYTKFELANITRYATEQRQSKSGQWKKYYKL